MARTTVLIMALSVPLLAGCGGDQAAKPDEGHGGHDHAADHATHHATPSVHGSSTPGHAGGQMPAVPPQAGNATCPVLGGPVDPRIFTEYKGRTVYFCCEECVEKFENDPERYFAKAYPDAGNR